MSEDWTPANGWPPRCCVPAFVYAALREQGIFVQEPRHLPCLLGVRVAKTDFNPFALDVVDGAAVAGISPSHADTRINELLRRHGTSSSFRHILLREIPFGLYRDVFDEAIRREVTVGLGLECTELLIDAPRETRLHLVRGIGRAERTIAMVDDSGQLRPGPFELPWDDVVNAMFKAGDGFWLIGPRKSLELPYTLPFGHSR